jgi:hypothetical protein
MQKGTLERLAPLTGVVFFGLIVTLFILSGNQPGVKDSTAKIVNFWHDHKTKEQVAAVLGALAVVFFIWFAGSLRAALRAAEGDRGRLSAVAFGGAIVFAVGGAVASMIQFTVADAVNHVPGTVTQSLSALNNDDFLPFVAGSATLLLAAAVVTLRHGGLPRWLAWIGIVIAIANFTPLGFIGFMGFLIWVLIVSITLYLRQPEASEPTPTGAEPR